MHFFSFWQRIPLRLRSVLLNGLPLFAVLCSAGFAWFSNQNREKAELSLNRHFDLVDQLAELRVTVQAAETNLAARLLTTMPRPATSDRGSADFAAMRTIPPRMDQIRNLISSSPRPTRRAEKMARFDLIQVGIDEELKFLGTMIMALSTPPVSATELGAQFRSHQLAVQALIHQIADMGSVEHKLLAKRLDEIREARHRDYLLIVLSVVLGVATRAVAMYFFHRSVVKRVRQLTENARILRDGGQPAHEPSSNQDDIGELERELASIGDFLAERRIKP